MIKKRNGEVITTNEGQNKILEIMYGTVWGRGLLKILVHPIISRIAGVFMDSRLSVPLIKPFIKSSGIDTSEYIMRDFRSYNEFFTRKIKPNARKTDLTPEHFVSPCDSKLSVYPIEKHSIFRIKDSWYSVSDLLRNPMLSRKYEGGWCMIFRLEVDDYHRYCYIDDGTKSRNKFIKGELHTVNPVALEHYNIYKRNSREYTILKTQNFGDIAQIEVGAMMVGKISNHHEIHSFKRGEEKGMFLFGGSTIVILAEKNRIIPDSDILKNTSEGFETVVKYGEKIGVKTEV